jgi:hypothetical protein
MNAKFNNNLNLRGNRMIVAARGPCEWEAGDASAVVRDVTVTRDNVVASGGGSTTVQNGAPGWGPLDVSSPSQLTPGRADAHAIAFVTKTDGTTYERKWYDDVQLQPSP